MEEAGANFLDELFAIDEHVFVEVFLTLLLVKSELEFVSVDNLLIKHTERLTKRGKHIRLIASVSSREACKLPNRLLICAFAFFFLSCSVFAP